MHSYPDLPKVPLTVELIDLHLEVQGTKIKAMVPSIGSRISDRPVVQVEV